MLVKHRHIQTLKLNYCNFCRMTQIQDCPDEESTKKYNLDTSNYLLCLICLNTCQVRGSITKCI